MPVDWSKYPDDWADISARIRERAGDRCEFCGIPNGTLGRRDRTGRWWHVTELEDATVSAIIIAFGRFPPGLSRIVITVAHMDHDTTHNDDENLRALCQRCHLEYDRDHHVANARETRRRKKIAEVYGGEITFS